MKIMSSETFSENIDGTCDEGEDPMVKYIERI